MARQQLAGNKFQQYQQATNQLLSIQQQQKANIAQASAEEAILLDKNKQLLQSSEYMAQQVAANNVLSQQVEMAAAQGAGGFNPATVGTLSQYGLGQPKQVKTQTISTSNQKQSNQKIIVNNKTENIVYNDVKVPAGSTAKKPVPVPIVTDKSKLDGGLGKFKSWLGNTFNQQSELSARKQREFRRKDAELTKQSNKMIRDLDKTSKSLGDRLDPKHVYRDVGSAFKNVLILLGLATIVENWPKLMNSINDIEHSVTDFVNNGINKTRDFFSDGGTFSVNMTKMLGGKPGESPGDAFKNLLFDEKEGLFAYISKYLNDRLEERAAAIKTVKKPNFSILDINASIGSLGTYLSDILAAILNPRGASKRSVVNSELEARKEDYNEYKFRGNNDKVKITDKTGQSRKERVYENDRTLVSGKYEGLTKDAVNKNGELTDKVSSYYSQSAFLNKNLKLAERGEINTANVGVGLERLYKSAQKNPKGKIPISVDFVKNILSQKEIDDLGLKEVQYKYVIRKRPYEDIEEDLKRSGKETKHTTTALRILFGGPIGLAKDLLDDSSDPTGIIHPIVKSINENNIPIYQYELVSPDEVQEDDIVAGVNTKLKPEEVPYVYEVSPDIITKLVEKLTGKSEIDVDINSEEFMSAIESGLMNLNKTNKVNKQVEDLSSLYAPNRLYEKNRADEKTMWENSRVVAAGEGISEVAGKLEDKLRNTRLGRSLFSDKESGTYKREGKNDVAWSDIRINKSDKQHAHEGTGPVGKDKINKDYLSNLFVREITGEFGRPEGKKDGCYLVDGYTSYGPGIIYSTLKSKYTGGITVIQPDGKPKSFDNLDDANTWITNYYKTLNIHGWSSEKGHLKLSDDTANSIIKVIGDKTVESLIESIDPDIMGAMDEQTLAGLIHIAHAGIVPFNNIAKFYKNNKEDSILDLNSNGGVHTEDFVNRVMMNTNEGRSALQASDKLGKHYDRRGYLTGYHAFNIYSGEEWDKHVELKNSKKLDNKSPETQKNNESANSPKTTTTQTSSNTSANSPATSISTNTSSPKSTPTTETSFNTSLPNIDIDNSLIENSENIAKIEKPNIESNNIIDTEVVDNDNVEIPGDSELSFESTTPEKVDMFDYELSSPAINTQTLQAKEINTDDKDAYIIPIAKFTEKLVNIDNLLSLVVNTSDSNLKATMNVLDALSAKNAVESKSIVNEVPSFSYTASSDNIGDNNDYSNVFYDYSGGTNLNNTQG